jgi:hypothetical protein
VLTLNQFFRIGSEVLNQASIPIFVLSLTLCGPAFAQDERPLGDVARDTRAAKSTAPKAAKVFTNDEVPDKADQSGKGPLSAEKEAYCEELRRRKDPSAEQNCELLRLDMGSEYEDLTARIFALDKNLCGATGGKGLPTRMPNDPQLAAQTRELSALNEKFLEMMNAQMKVFSNAEIETMAIRKEEAAELATAAPNWERPTEQSTALEKQRFEEIEKKYKPRIQEKDDAAQRIRPRGLRYLVDQARMQNVCNIHDPQRP